MRTSTKLTHSIGHVKCAAVLAKRWQSATHCSTDSVAGRAKLSYHSGVIQCQPPTPRPGAPTAETPPCSIPFRALPATGASTKKLILATFVMQPAMRI